MSKQRALWESLVAGVDLQRFKPLKYFPQPGEASDLTGDENAPAAPNWFPSIVTEVLPYKVDGHEAVALTVFRPARFGGMMQLGAVAFTNTHDDGTCDTIGESDVGSIIGTLNPIGG
jgi:hypothetical protein